LKNLLKLTSRPLSAPSGIVSLRMAIGLLFHWYND
jgi:hypothetical protein